MPIEIKELIIRANVESNRENTSFRASDNRNNAKVNMHLDDLMKIKKMIENQNER